MTTGTSRRGFVTLVFGALAGLAAGVGRALGRQRADDDRAHDFDSAAHDGAPDARSATTYTYDAMGRLLSVTERGQSADAAIGP